MVSTPPPVTSAVIGARPVDASERLILLDILRAVALCGVFVSNAYMHLSGRGLLPKESAEALLSTRVDVVTDFLFTRLVAEKAMSMFSFLFGLGFSIQMGRAEARGASVVSVYSRRLGVLLLIGLTHLFALWYGDVLNLYAMTGFVLLLFRKLPDKRLLVWSLVLIIGAPLVVTAVMTYVPLLASSPEAVQEASKANMANVAAIRSETLAAFQSGSYLTTARANAIFYWKIFLKPMTFAHGLISLGRFLLGLLAGRRRIFHDVEANRPLFRRLIGWGLVLAVLGNGVGLLVDHLLKAGVFSRPALWWRLLFQSVWEVGVLGLTAFYVAGLSLLFLRPRARRFLAVLAPAGQMALTNYLSQTVISQFIYYGYGFNLIGKLRPLPCLALMFGLFWVQVLVSHLWLARFRFGPVEWVWRSLTYGKSQPMRRAPAREQDVAPAA
ncbi:DUF418 domain-containing protein [Vitiosangium sp. GDMCC 1.1324]|uniref:DUF418 domain-containing protein n=1 Tax=Vitiosangium sp. (strain GDMCC 1.1324) TaxID=2138576 RepID=UPI000D3445DB|nr:DUF418 domain-containing protein [Vitiosangium sp. GDMCC 1.1324]PTL84353.1 transporter [Vitiosangium sp. GDMCC 1.1324]